MNPDKFQAFAVGGETFDEKPTFNIGEAEISGDETVKFLGTEIDSLLSFDTQVSNMCKRVSQQINILRRIGKYLNFESRKAVYHAFIMSTFNFCPLVWHFCYKSNTEKLERIHFRALKFMFSSMMTLLAERVPPLFIYPV